MVNQAGKSDQPVGYGKGRSTEGKAGNAGIGYNILRPTREFPVTGWSATPAQCSRKLILRQARPIFEVAEDTSSTEAETKVESLGIAILLVLFVEYPSRGAVNMFTVIIKNTTFKSSFCQISSACVRPPSNEKLRYFVMARGGR